jgi:DNA-binding MarR family transcriptional regulator
LAKQDEFRSKTSRIIYQRIGMSLQVMVDHGIPPETTIRELQALNKMTQIFFSREYVTPTLLVQQTGLSPATVSRYLAQWRLVGWLKETRDPDDGRLTLLRLTEDALENSDSLVRAMLQMPPPPQP